MNQRNLDFCEKCNSEVPLVVQTANIKITRWTDMKYETRPDERSLWIKYSVDFACNNCSTVLGRSEGVEEKNLEKLLNTGLTFTD